MTKELNYTFFIVRWPKNASHLERRRLNVHKPLELIGVYFMKTITIHLKIKVIIPRRKQQKDKRSINSKCTYNSL